MSTGTQLNEPAPMLTLREVPMRVRYLIEGHPIRSATLLGITESFGMTHVESRVVVSAIMQPDGVWHGVVSGRRAWVWECPRIEFVQPQWPDGEPDADFVYADGPLADRYAGRGLTTPEPKLVQEFFRRGFLPPKERVGAYTADYSALSPEEAAASDAENDALIEGSRTLSTKKIAAE